MDILEWIDEYEPCGKLEEWQKYFIKTNKNFNIHAIHSPKGNNLCCDIWKEKENEKS